jgi:hypothetical protein
MSILVVLSASGKNSHAQGRRSRLLVQNPECVYGAEKRLHEKTAPANRRGRSSLLPIYDPLPLLVQALFTHFTLPAAVSDPPLPVAVSVTVRFPFAV